MRSQMYQVQKLSIPARVITFIFRIFCHHIFVIVLMLQNKKLWWRLVNKFLLNRVYLIKPFVFHSSRSLETYFRKCTMRRRKVFFKNYFLLQTVDVFIRCSAFSVLSFTLITVDRLPAVKLYTIPRRHRT